MSIHITIFDVSFMLGQICLQGYEPKEQGDDP